MKIWLILTSLLGTAFSGGLPYLNPGLAYSSTAYGNLAYKAFPYAAAGPLTSYTSASFGAAPLAAAPLAAASYAAPPLAAASYAAAPLAAASYAAAPLATTSFAASRLAAARFAAAPYAASSFIAAAPLPAGPLIAPAPVAAAPLVAAAPIAPAPIAAKVVPAIEHVPAVADIPVTKFQAQPAVIQNVVDVAHPKIATRRFEIRRPAIQKQFYDIEERVVVKPAGSAVVELEQPLSSNQQGPTKVTSAYASNTFIPSVAAPLPVPAPVFPAPFPAFPGPQPLPSGPSQQTPTPQQPEETQETSQDNSDSVSVDNPEFARFRIIQAQEEKQQQSRLNDLLASRARFESNTASLRQQFSARTEEGSKQESSFGQEFSAQTQSQPQTQPQPQPTRPQVQPFEPQPPSQPTQPQPQPFEPQPFEPQPQPQPLPSQPQPFEPQPAQFRSSQFSSSKSFESSDVIPSVRNLSPEQSAYNQAKFIELLTARGGVAEVKSAGESPQVQARVISVTAAPPTPGEERVNTRRVVVNRPIQTVQEVDVVEPFTKLERVAVHEPAVIKTAHVGIARVPTSVPVHTYAHAAYI